MKKGIFKFSIQDICEIAILCALGVVLDRFVKIPLGGSGGSLNFSMVPIMIICLRHGPFKGFIAGGIIFGLITCIFDGYGFQYYPLEYFVAFGSIFVLGFFGKYINKQFSTDNMKGMLISYALIIASICLWAVVRLFAASIDTMIFYSADYPTFPLAIGYNAPYIFLSAPLDLIIVIALLPVTIKLNKMYKTSYLKEQITIPDYSNQNYLGLWYNAKVAVNLLENGNAIAYYYDDGSEVKYSGAYRMNNNSMEISVYGRLAKSTYTYDATNNIFISVNDVLTREKSKIYKSENIMVVVTASKTYVIENSSVSDKVVEGTIEEGATIKIGETEYTVKDDKLVAKGGEVVTPPTPGPGEEDNKIPSYCGTWTGKVGVNNYTVVVKSDGTLIINGDSYTYTYDNGTLTNNSSLFTITYNETKQSLNVIYDDGDYYFEGTLTTFVKEEASTGDKPTDTRPMSEQVIGTYEGEWGVTYYSYCKVVLSADGTGYFENSTEVIAHFTYEVDDQGKITCTITDQGSLYENLNFTYDSETQVLTGSAYEWDQMLNYTFNVVKKA